MNVLTTDKTVFKDTDYTEFLNIIDDIISNKTVQKMNDYKHHCDTTCFEHCFNVAYYTYIISKKLKLDYKSATRGAMLHDLFLYDWRHTSKKCKRFKDLHAFSHPRTALHNSLKLFNLNETEKDVILNHMWPVTPKLPKTKEGFIITFADKFSALNESFTYFTNNLHKKKSYKYAYVFLSLIVFRII